MNTRYRKLFMAIAFGLWIWFLIGGFSGTRTAPSELEYSTFITEVQQGRVQEVLIRGQAISGLMKDGTRFQTHNPGDNGLVGDLLEYNVRVASKAPDQPGLLMQILVSWMPMLLLIGVWIWFMRRNTGGGGA